MPSINEQTSAQLDITFYDEAKQPVIPDSATYRIDDESGTVITGETSFTPTAATHTLDITKTENRILDTTKSSEDRTVTIIWQYGAKQGTYAFVYSIKNLTQIV